MDVRIFFKNDERVPLFLLILEVWPEPNLQFFLRRGSWLQAKQKDDHPKQDFFCTKSDVS